MQYLLTQEELDAKSADFRCAVKHEVSAFRATAINIVTDYAAENRMPGCRPYGLDYFVKRLRDAIFELDDSVDQL